MSLSGSAFAGLSVRRNLRHVTTRHVLCDRRHNIMRKRRIVYLPRHHSVTSLFMTLVNSVKHPDTFLLANDKRNHFRATLKKKIFWFKKMHLLESYLLGSRKYYFTGVIIIKNKHIYFFDLNKSILWLYFLDGNTYFLFLRKWFPWLERSRFIEIWLVLWRNICLIR